MLGRPLLSSTPLQISYSLNKYYDGFFFISQIILIIYKTEVLPYPGENIALDVVLLVCWLMTELTRIFVGSSGNLTEKVFATLISIILIIGSAVLAFYFFFWQTYVLRLDIVLCSFLFGFLGFELLFSIITLTTFSKAQTM